MGALRRCRVVAVSAVVALLPSAGPSSAQSLPEKVWNDLRWAAEDAFFLATSPLHGSSSDWRAAGWITAATGASLLIDEPLDDWIVDNGSAFVIEPVHPFTEGHDARLEELGSGSLMVQVAGVMYLAGLVFDSQDLRDAGIGCAAAEKTQSAIRHGVYKVVSRRRPESADGDPFMVSVPGGDWKDHSFFGGHGANIMTCAAFWTRRFDLGYAEPVIMGLAIGVGAGRVVDRKHWLSDALVGGVVGYVIGKTFADRQRGRVDGRRGEDVGSAGPPLGGLFVAKDGERVLLGMRRGLRF